MKIEEMFKHSKIDIKSLILFTPFDKRFMVHLPKNFQEHMTNELFLKEFYIHDVLKQEICDLKKQIDEIDKNTENSEKNNEKLELQRKLSLAELELDKKNEFKKELQGESLYPFYIRGSSGSGKSTYMHHLLYTIKEEDSDSILLDFDLYNSSRNISFFGKRWSNSKFTFTQFKLASLLLKKIDELLNIEFNSINEKTAYYLKLFNNHKKHSNYIKYYEYAKLFDIIYQYANDEVSYNEGINSYCNLMYNYFEDLCAFDKKTSIKDIDITDIISKLLEIIITVIICNSDFPDKENEIPNIFVSFDNIEHYIQNDKIYNDDIREITTMIQDFMDYQGVLLEKYDFYSHFKFILAIRDTTDKIISPIDEHEEDFSNNKIDVSNWFNVLDIYNKKINYFKGNGIFKDDKTLNNTIKAIEYIFEDQTLYGLRTTLNSMYNNNKRRITRYIFSVISRNPVRISRYIELWEKSKTTNNHELSKIYKHAARSIIKRSLYDLIEETLYFKKLKSINIGNDDSGLGMARKILTILYRYNPQLDDNNEYLDFYHLIKELINNPFYDSVDESYARNKIKIIVDILLELNNSSIYKTNWCQLIDIKFNRKTLNENIKNIMEEVIYDIYINRNADAVNYGVKLTSAGKHFLTICPEFEYFCCRYKKNSEPIFSEENITNSLKTINYIKKQTFKCIDKIIENDKAFVSQNNVYNYNVLYSDDVVVRHYLYSSHVNSAQDFGLEENHTLRILNSHIGHIDMYRTFVLFNKNIKEDDRRVISTKLLEIIDEYIAKIKELCNISSRCEGTITYYIGGSKRTNGEYRYDEMTDYSGKLFYQVYLDQVEKARKQPLNEYIRIIREMK